MKVKSDKHRAYIDFTGRAKARQAMAEYEVRKDTRERDLVALAAVQASRPLKPPGKR